MIRIVGTIGPLLFFAAAVAVAYFTPGYDSATQMISELGATGADNALYFNYFGFLPNGICITLTGFLLYQQMKSANFPGIVAWLIMLHGIGMILATWISCDSSCTPNEPSPDQIAHNIIAAVKFPALHLAMIIFAVQLLKRGNNKPAAYWSIFAFIASGLFMLLFVGSVKSREYTGIYQRLFIGSLYIWLIAFSFNIKTVLSRQYQQQGTQIPG